VTSCLQRPTGPQTRSGEARKYSKPVYATTLGHGRPRWVMSQLVAHWPGNQGPAQSQSLLYLSRTDHFTVCK